MIINVAVTTMQAPTKTKPVPGPGVNQVNIAFGKK